MQGAGSRAFNGPRLIVLALAGLLTGLLPGAAGAQLLGNDAQAQDCAAAIGGDVTDSSVKVICGMPTGEVVALVQALNSPDPAAKAEALELLRARLPRDTRFRLEAIRGSSRSSVGNASNRRSLPIPSPGSPKTICDCASGCGHSRATIPRSRRCASRRRRRWSVPITTRRANISRRRGNGQGQARGAARRLHRAGARGGAPGRRAGRCRARPPGACGGGGAL